MTTIHKYRLEAAAEQDISIPCDSGGIDILHVAWQQVTTSKGHLHIWAHVMPDAPTRPVTVYVRTTGQPMGAADRACHLGTVLLHQGAIVFHVFIEKDPNVRIRGALTG